MNEANKIIFRPLHKDDVVNQLSMGHKDFVPLKIFLKEEAITLHNESIVNTFIIAQEEKPKIVKAYISLMASEIRITAQPSLLSIENFNYKYEYVPAIKIARLAVDKSLRGNGYGSQLILLSIKNIKEYVVPSIGCRYIIVDSKKNAVSFYEALGFKVFNDPKKNASNKSISMLIDLLSIDTTENINYVDEIKLENKLTDLQKNIKERELQLRE